MIVHFFAFPLFLLASVLIGVSFAAALMRVIKSTAPLELDLGIHGFIGIFAFGMLATIYNFFAPLDSILFYLLAVGAVISGIVVVIRNKLRAPSVEVGSLFIASTVLAPFAGSLTPGYDAGLYHLPFQLWLRDEPIVIGLANLHGRFGFGSLYEYVAAPLWLGARFTLLSYLQVAFLAFFLVFLVRQAERARGLHLTLLVAIAINVLAFNDYMLIEYSYTDVPAGLTFVAAFLFGHWLLFQDGGVTRWHWAVFALISLFAVLLKLSSAVLFLWCVFVVSFRLFKRKDPVRELLWGIAIPALLFVIYLFRNIVSTGCLLYPLSASCLDVPWAATANAQNDANWITAWARHPKSGLYSLEDFGWLQAWWIPRYERFFIELTKAGMIVLGFYALFLFLRRRLPRAQTDFRFIGSLLFTLVALAFWFQQAPDPRFGVGVFVLLFPVAFSFLHVAEKNGTEAFGPSRRAVLLLVITVTAFSIGTPWKLVDYRNILHFNPLVVPTPAVTPRQPYGVRPQQGDQCWLVPECAPYDRPGRSSFHGRTMFTPTDAP